MNASALCGTGYVSWRVRRAENRVDHVNQSVARDDISSDDRRIVDHHSVGIDGEGQWLPVCCICRHAICDSRGGDFCRNNVVEQDVGEGRLSFRSIEGA